MSVHICIPLVERFEYISSKLGAKRVCISPDLYGGASRPALARRYLVRPRTSVVGDGGGGAPPQSSAEEEEEEGGSHRKDPADSEGRGCVEGGNRKSRVGFVTVMVGDDDGTVS